MELVKGEELMLLALPTSAPAPSAATGLLPELGVAGCHRRLHHGLGHRPLPRLAPMTSKPPQPNATAEAARLELLEGVDLDALREQVDLDGIARRASAAVGVPIAMVSLITSDRQCILGREGIDYLSYARGDSLCSHAVTQDRVLIIEDVLANSAFRQIDFVVDTLRIRFYAGIPILWANKIPIGTLCVADHQPRRLLPAQRAELMGLIYEVESKLSAALPAAKRTGGVDGPQVQMLEARQELVLRLLQSAHASVSSARGGAPVADTPLLEELEAQLAQTLDVLGSRSTRTLGDQRVALTPLLRRLASDVEQARVGLVVEVSVDDGRDRIPGHPGLLHRAFDAIFGALTASRAAATARELLRVHLSEREGHRIVDIYQREAVPDTLELGIDTGDGEPEEGLASDTELDALPVFSDEQLTVARAIIEAHGGNLHLGVEPDGVRHLAVTLPGHWEMPW